MNESIKQLLIEMEFRAIPVIGKRPDHIPENWLIFNAPRPLLGHEYWQGDFQHGIFYVGLDYDDDYVFKMWLERNKGLDAWLVFYWTEDEIKQWILNYYKEKYSQDIIGYIEDNLNGLMIQQAFYNHMGGGISFGEYIKKGGLIK